MMTISFSEFRKNVSAIFSSVENGETIHVLRHGKEIAQIAPVNEKQSIDPSWKKKRIKRTVGGDSLSKLILQERESLQ